MKEQCIKNLESFINACNALDSIVDILGCDFGCENPIDNALANLIELILATINPKILTDDDLADEAFSYIYGDDVLGNPNPNYETIYNYIKDL